MGLKSSSRKTEVRKVEYHHVHDSLLSLVDIMIICILKPK